MACLAIKFNTQILAKVFNDNYYLVLSFWWLFLKFLELAQNTDNKIRSYNKSLISKLFLSWL